MPSFHHGRVKIKVLRRCYTRIENCVLLVTKHINTYEKEGDLNTSGYLANSGSCSKQRV